MKADSLTFLFHIISAVLFLCAVDFAQGDFTEQTSIPLPGVQGSAVWGDYNNDGHLDILLTGANLLKVYRNNGDNTFTEQMSIDLPANGGKGIWGDYDNDGYLDILLAGFSASKIYRNNGDNTFTEQSAISLIGVTDNSAAWADYDNDGNLDLILSGATGGGMEPPSTTKIYRNNGDNSFTEQSSISLQSWCEVDWGDYDNDGDLDLLMMGKANDNKYSFIYKNNGDNTFTYKSSISIKGSYAGAWGDYDNDGNLDIALTHYDTTRIYRNNGNETFSETASISLPGVTAIAWADYDNDGNLDLLLTGIDNSFSYISKIYRNNGDNTFTEQSSASITGVSNASISWGDYDSDGDLDILLTGMTKDSSITKIYRNNSSKQNTLPSQPTNLQTVIKGHDVTFSWNRSNDNETPQNGLTYNLEIGISENTANILSPMSDLSTGFRRIVSRGNADEDTSWTVKGLTDGEYYWSVQAVDNCFAGSPFPTAQSFIVQSPGTIIITSPKGGEIWEAGTHSVITYSSLGNSGHVNLDYSIDGGITWDTIAGNIVDSGKWENWIVPNTPSTKCKIRISDTDGDPVVISDNTFTITGVVPVELVSFTAKSNENKVMLDWETATEVNNYGFEIERKLYSRSWERIGFIKGNGSVSSPKSYQYVDRPVGGNKFLYRLKQLDMNRKFSYSKEVEVELIPKKYELLQNYPNPFNPRTTIQFSVPKTTELSINVYTILGEKVLTAAEGKYETGYYQLEINCSNLPSGIYIYRLESSEYNQTKKMVILK